MRGALFVGDRKVEVRQFPDPLPGPGEVILEIKASGMCGSDLKFYRPAPGEAQRALGLGDISEPIIGGHEPCGVVAAVGPGVNEAEAKVGQRVMDHHYCGCGVCQHCRVGWSQLCGNGFVVYGVTANGAHADYMKVPARTLVPLPDELSFATGAAISCGTGTAYNALRRMDLCGRHTLAVFGQGPVGVSAVQLASAMGARVIALDPTPERRAFATDFGAETRDRPRGRRPGRDAQGADPRRGRRPRARLLGRRGRALGRGARDPHLGHGLLRRRGRQRHHRRQPRHDPQAAHGDRLLDLLLGDPGRVRALRRRPRHRRRAPVHPALDPRPSRRGLPPVRHPDHRQGRVPVLAGWTRSRPGRSAAPTSA